MPVANTQNLLQRFLSEATVQIVPITAEIGRLAIEAFARFGRSNHPARLNMGDCFSYACARHLGVALLFKGEDFSQTDIAVG
jgi:ribonuclease VapC